MKYLDKKIVQSDPLNRDYRDTTARLIDMAEKEIITVVGEIGAYTFLDVRWSLEEAIDRGVRVSIYAFNPRPDIRNRLIELGVKLYLGSEVPPQKYLVVDGKHWYIAKPEEQEKRAGEAHFDDPKGASPLVREFQRYIKDKKPIDKVAWEDPLLQLTQD